MSTKSTKSPTIRTIATKRCRNCVLTKPLTEFYRNKSMPDGRRPQCKLCWQAYLNRWNAQNIEKVRESKTRYNRKHANEVLRDRLAAQRSMLAAYRKADPTDRLHTRIDALCRIAEAAGKLCHVVGERTADGDFSPLPQASLSEEERTRIRHHVYEHWAAVKTALHQAEVPDEEEP